MVRIRPSPIYKTAPPEPSDLLHTDGGAIPGLAKPTSLYSSFQPVFVCGGALEWQAEGTPGDSRQPAGVRGGEGCRLVWWWWGGGGGLEGVLNLGPLILRTNKATRKSLGP